MAKDMLELRQGGEEKSVQEWCSHIQDPWRGGKRGWITKDLKPAPCSLDVPRGLWAPQKGIKQMRFTISEVALVCQLQPGEGLGMGLDLLSLGGGQRRCQQDQGYTSLLTTSSKRLCCYLAFICAI